MEAWYLLFSKPQQERVARDNLLRQGYEVYLPLMRHRRRRAGRYVTRIEAMFPRYLFIRLNDVTDNWGPIRSTLGVSNMVRFTSEAARVPDDLIGALRAREDEQGIQALEPPRLKPGDRVRIEEGVFSGYEAIFQAQTSKSRVLLLLEIAGNAARIQLEADHIEAVR